MIFGVVVLLVGVWLCAYASVRTGRFYLFYAVAVIPVAALVGLGYGALWGQEGSIPAGAIILMAMAVAAVFYPVNVWRLRLER